MSASFKIDRRSILALGVAGAASVVLAEPAAASVGIVAKIVQEPDTYEARFPDVIKLDDGSLLAVWHRAEAHSGTIGTIRMSFGSADGRTWSTPTRALPAGALSTLDTRDPKLGRMKDGSIVMTFFCPDPSTDPDSSFVHYAVWKPGWPSFDAPLQLETPGITQRVFCHGGAVALADNGTWTDQVLVPFYVWSSTGGAYYARATWRPTVNPRLLVSSVHRIIASNNPVGRLYGEPSMVQIGGTVVGVVRAQQDGVASPAIVVRWNPYTTSPSFTYQYYTGVLASSHHLLKTSDGRVLFTYGDAGRVNRPTVGTIITNPTAAWPAHTPTLIYDSGAQDQANPSSVEISPGTFLTTGYNAKPKSVSPYGGTLWLIESHTADY